MQWRALVPRLGPKWLVTDVIKTDDGNDREVPSRVLYAIMSLFDVQKARIRYGVLARMTQLAPEDALQYIGRALDVIRGPDESLTSYRARLQTGIDDKRKAGIAWTLLSQIRGYCAPHAVRVRLVNEHGHFYTIDRDGTLSRNRYTAWNWDNARALALKLGTSRQRADGNVGPAIPWSTFWVIIYPTTDTPSQPWQRDGTWGDGGKWGDDGTTWGSTATKGDVAAVRRIVKRWKPLGSRCVSIIISFDDTAFDPTNTAPPLPDGSWKWCSKYDPATPGKRVRARNANALFWDGTSPGEPL